MSKRDEEREKRLAEAPDINHQRELSCHCHLMKARAKLPGRVLVKAAKLQSGFLPRDSG